MGIEVNQWGRPVAYWISPGHPSDAGGSLVRERIPADQIIHFYDSERVNQTRGVPAFHAVMMALKMLDGYVEAELVAARTAAAKMGWLKYTDSSAFQEPSLNQERIRIEANPGVIETIPPGMDYVESNPNHPTNAFGHFTQGVLRLIASGLGVSYNALANDLVGVTYSSMRSGLLVERENWRREQSSFAEDLLDPIFRAWLPMALLTGTLKLDSLDPKKFLAGKWKPRGWMWVDPLKDAQSAVLAVGAAMKSRDQIIGEMGGDFETVAEQLSEENDIAEEYGLKLTTSLPPKPNGEDNPDQAATAGRRRRLTTRGIGKLWRVQDDVWGWRSRTARGTVSSEDEAIAAVSRAAAAEAGTA